ncbi:CUB and sushi domain-containing protein 1-like [Acipenser oxyrinchus oxyrinchus]|uniref:CUB and sushi domain-containing protein 1-like n=1 Tax=Acipenser oxyrinchus oxyrinchus TaxID=40147 RepID=A0AAD8FWL7_ACIOX|nr:CUB and sushi domain-containing protein 1-like [Acipenser oxyrinchus oxyrinchus]
MRLLLLSYLLLTGSLRAFVQEQLEGSQDAALDTYWSGTAPLCMGGCRGKHKELKQDDCGDGSCCWLGYKSFCRVNCGKPDSDFNSLVFGNDWWVGSVVRYTCRPGFLLIGDPARACQSDGKWTPKPSCLRICLRGRLEINEKDIDGSCSSTCSSKAHFGSLNHGCIKIDNCLTKQSGWKRWFMRCDVCECDCFIPCSESEQHRAPCSWAQYS